MTKKHRIKKRKNVGRQDADGKDGFRPEPSTGHPPPGTDPEAPSIDFLKVKIRNTKHLLENKKDVDENVENILRMIGEENEQAENEKTDSENSFKKSKLSSLVKGFHDDYQYLHKHYKQLISKLENVGHNSSSSDSSDTDIEGDKSDNDTSAPKQALVEENGWKHKLAENHNTEAEIEKLKQNTEEQAKEISDLKELLDKSIKDKEATAVELISEVANLSSQNENLKSLVESAERKVAESLKGLTSMENDIKTLSSEKQIIENGRDNLKMSVADMEKEREDFSNQLKDTVEKCTLQSSELEKARLAENEVQTLLAENQKLKNDNLVLFAEHGDLKARLHNLDMECSKLRETISDAKAENRSLIKEKHIVESKVEQLGMDIDGLKVEKEELMDNLNKKLWTSAEEKERLVLEHSKCLDELEMARSNVLELEKELESTKSVLNGNIVDLQNEKNSGASEIKQLKVFVKNLEGQLEQQSEQLSILQLANEDLQKSNTTLKMQLEETLVGHHYEVLALQDEKNKVFSELQQSGASVKNLRTELEQGREEISILHLANKDMKNNIASLDKQLEEVRSSLHAEIAAVHGEKDAALLELQTSQASVRSFESVVEKQSENISSLQQANDELQKNICTLTEQSKQAKAELQEEVKATQEEKDTVVTQLKQSESSIQNLENEVAQLTKELSVHLENNSTLGKQLEEATLKVSNLSEKLEKSQAEVASHIDDMRIKTKDLENTINVLSSQKTKVEEDLKILFEACTGNMSLMKEFEDTIKQRITDHETRVGPLYHSVRGVLCSFQKLQYAYDEMSTRASQFEVLKENQTEQIDQLEGKNNEMLDKNRLLEEEKLNANKENAELHKHIQDLEVQVQLTKQKLKVTEAESKCKDDSYAMAVETSQADIQNLEQLVQQNSGRVSLLEETLVQVKEHAESGIFSLAEKLDELESSFSQGFTRFVDRSFACSEELKVLRNKLRDHLDKQKELLKEKDELVLRLRDKEKVLSEMVKNAAEAEEKASHLEKKMQEKEEELAARVQEKREAIKQLSDAIIYHKNNSDDLVRYIRSHNRPRLPFCM